MFGKGMFGQSYMDSMASTAISCILQGKPFPTIETGLNHSRLFRCGVLPEMMTGNNCYHIKEAYRIRRERVRSGKIVPAQQGSIGKLEKNEDKKMKRKIEKLEKKMKGKIEKMEKKMKSKMEEKLERMMEEKKKTMAAAAEESSNPNMNVDDMLMGEIVPTQQGDVGKLEKKMRRKLEKKMKMKMEKMLETEKIKIEKMLETEKMKTSAGEASSAGVGIVGELRRCTEQQLEAEANKNASEDTPQQGI